MSRLLIVRHGQASFGAADYDQLSELGYLQSQRLGEHLAGKNCAIDAIYCGPAKRHKQTLESVREGAALAGVDLPEATTHEGLAEFPAFKLMAMHRNQGAQQASGIGFEEMCEAWMHGHIDSGDLESAIQFAQRVEAALREIRSAQGRGKTVLLVTSGGPKMIAMKAALHLHPGKATDLLWVIANSSLSEFRYRDDSLSLVAFNSQAHLDAEHITYR